MTILKKFFISTLFFISFLFILSFSINFLFEEEIGEIVLLNIKKHVQTEISVNNIRLNIYEDFPYVSIKLEELKIKESSKFEEEDLIYAKKHQFRSRKAIK